jgi:hypothetical protein
MSKFQPGNTFGRGRPKGSRNRPGSPVKQLLDEYASSVTRKCIAMALGGNPGAMRICMECIRPARRDPFLQMNLPPMKTAKDVDRAAEKLTQAIRRGDLSPSEIETLSKIIESRARGIERVEFESRVENLERNLAARNKRSSPSK